MANNIRFGSSSGPCSNRTAMEERAPWVEEEPEDRSNIDPDRLLQCPFDKNHQIRACRFPYHLIKCRKNHPELASKLKTCPFNARHLVPKEELEHHTQTCENRVSVDLEKEEAAKGPCLWHVPVSTWVNPNPSEDWDQEADDDAPPFIWGADKNKELYSDVEATNHLGPHFRAPRTLPWSAFNGANGDQF